VTDIDYTKLIDAQTWAFIRETEIWYPPNTITLSIGKQRDIYNKMCRAFFNGYPSGVEAQDHSANGVPVRRYEKNTYEATALVLYFHGGGFVVGGLDSHDDVCAEICDRTGFTVISVDYRLAPEHLHPAAFDDCMTAFQWAISTFDLPLVLAGDSAGGTMVAAVAHNTRAQKPNAAGCVLIYPSLGQMKHTGSYSTHANAPLLTHADIEFYATIRTGGVEPYKDATYTPLSDTAFSALPPTVVISAECDPLCDDGKEYCREILNAGGQAIWIKEPGLVHGFLRARHNVERARHSFSRIITAIDIFGNENNLTANDLTRIGQPT